MNLNRKSDSKKVSHNGIKAPEEQLAYASILNIGKWIGLLVLVVTFIVYVSGVVPSFVSVEELSKYWSLKVQDYIQALNLPTGWGWITVIGKGDYLNYIGIAILGGLTVLCYLAILPILIRKRDIPYVIITIIEVAVLLLAASGILKVVGH